MGGRDGMRGHPMYLPNTYQKPSNNLRHQLAVTKHMLIKMTSSLRLAGMTKQAR